MGNVGDVGPTGEARAVLSALAVVPDPRAPHCPIGTRGTMCTGHQGVVQRAHASVGLAGSPVGQKVVKHNFLHNCSSATRDDDKGG